MNQILLLNRQQINDKNWDLFIENSPQKIIYAYTWYLDIVAPRWSALILQENEKWLAVLPIPQTRKFGTWVVQQPLFCQILGMFLQNSIQSKNEKEQITATLFEALKINFKYISTYSGRFFGRLETDNVRGCFTHLLNLNKPYQAIQNNYTDDRKKNLARATQRNWQIAHSIDIEPLIEIFTANHAKQIEGGVCENAYQLLRQVYLKLLEKNAVKLLYARKNDQIEAGAMFAIFESRIIYLFNAATNSGRKENARTFLIDHIIEQYAGKEYFFDFESPMVPSISAFYESFGSERNHFLEIRYNNLPFPLKQIQDWRLEK